VLFSAVLLHQGKTIGRGRVVGDGGLYFYIHDIAVLPAHDTRSAQPRVAGKNLEELSGKRALSLGGLRERQRTQHRPARR
jgi:hypothetical protein